MSEQTEHNTNDFETYGNQVYPPKPVVVEKNQNALTRSVISLLVYALLFYFLFDQNVAYIAAILLVIIIHEMGHFLFMKLFNYSNVKIFIVPLLGAFTSGTKQKVSQWQLSVIILAGPVPGIVIGCLLYYFNRQWHSETVRMLAYCFLGINLLNCLPFHPLDGGRLIETLFFKENHIIRLVFGIISIMGMIIICLLSSSIILLVVPVFIVFELINENKHQKIRDYLKQEKINYRTDYESLSSREYWLIRDCLLLSFPKKYPGIPAGNYQYSTAEALIIQQIKAVLQTDLANDLNGLKKLLVLLFYMCAFILPIMYVLATSMP